MRLQNAPLVHVLAQVVFSPVLRFEDRLRAFRDAVHGAGFPWVLESFIHEVTVVANPEAAPVPSVSVRPRWDFLRADRRTGVTLTERLLVLQTTEYLSSGPFLEQLREVLAICAAAVGPELVERVGLRFTDVVRVARGERFSQFVQPGLLGFPFREAPALEARAVGLQSETVAQTPFGVFVVRSAVLPPGQLVPADLIPTTLVHPPIAPEYAETPGLALDFDHFVQFNQPPHNQQPFSFTPDGILEVIRGLHQGHRAAFEAAGTADAFERWGPWVD